MGRRFSAEVETILRQGGWFEGRRFDLTVYDEFPMRPHAAAGEVLAEFGGLQLGEVGPGIDCARSDIDLTPAWTDSEFTGWSDLDQRVGSRLYPLGEFHRGNAYLLIDEARRIHAIGPGDLFLIAPTFDEALELLLLGKRPAGDRAPSSID